MYTLTKTMLNSEVHKRSIHAVIWTGQPFRLRSARHRQQWPGERERHLHCVLAATAIVCEGDTMNIACPGDSHIAILQVNYGRRSSSICCQSVSPDLCTNMNCGMTESLAIANQRYVIYYLLMTNVSMTGISWCSTPFGFVQHTDCWVDILPCRRQAISRVCYKDAYIWVPVRCELANSECAIFRRENTNN